MTQSTIVFDKSSVWTPEHPGHLKVRGISAGGGGGGGGGPSGTVGKKGQDATWHSTELDLIAGQKLVTVIGASGRGGQSAKPHDVRGEDGGAGGLSYFTDGSFVYPFTTDNTPREADHTSTSTSSAKIEEVNENIPVTPQYAIVDSLTHRVENIIVADEEFFHDDLAKLVVLQSRIIKTDEGKYKLRPRGPNAVAIVIGSKERVAPGWLYFNAAKFEVLEGEISDRFIRQEYPGYGLDWLGTKGGLGGTKKLSPDFTGGIKLLFVATEWSSGKGGLSTINRELCIACAKLKNSVVCFVPSGTVTADDRAEAKSFGVHLVESQPTTGKDVGQLAGLYRRPELPLNFDPNVIVGHGRVTGFAAQALEQDYFSAIRVQIVHTQPEEVEWHKPRALDGSARMENSEKEERIIASSASLVVGVGPRLKRQAEKYLHSQNHHGTIFELIPGFETDLNQRHPPSTIDCVFVGRAEDAYLKGLDIAAHAVRLARETGTSANLVVRGAVPGSGTKLQQELSQTVDALNAVNVYEYSSDNEAVRANYLLASVVLMPSRSEGFGLVGQEAIKMGIPVLISSESGLAELIQRDAPQFEPDFIVKMSYGDDDNYSEWGKRLVQILSDRPKAFARMAELREVLASKFSWETTASGLLGTINQVANLRVS
jgi:glycosyltransferase involved in cell wall biosynthesis